MSLRRWRVRGLCLQGANGVILAAVSAGIVGCATIPFQPTPSEKIPEKIWRPGELLQSLSQRLEQFRSVRTLANVYYSGPEGRGRFYEAILVRRPDQLRLETLSQLGAILIVTVDRNQIVGFHPREGLFYRGSSSKENLLRYTQIPLELAEVTSLLLGLPPVEIRVPFQREKNELVFPLDGGSKDVVTFDSNRPVPKKWERLDTHGEVALSAEFDDYTETPAGLFPLKIVVDAHTQGKRLEIRYQEPELNVQLPIALFMQKKPANAKEIPLESIGG